MELNILYSNIWQIRDTDETKLNAEKTKLFDLFIGCNASICMPPKEKRDVSALEQLTSLHRKPLT